MNTIAKKLTLNEIKALSRGTVLWAEFDDLTDEGIVWYALDPVVICQEGENGCLIGGNKDSIIDRDINDDLLENLSLWTSEPNKEQLAGITEQEYNDLTDEGKIVFPELAAAITSRRYTFEAFCTSAGLDYPKFWNAITGKREFNRHEIITIRSALNLPDEEVMRIFFPEALAQI